MISLPGVPNLTAEQQSILETCPPPPRPSSAITDQNNNTTKKGQLTRITAAAGTGKTTTLLALAVRAVHELGHQHVTYVTFTNAAAQEGKERLERVILGNPDLQQQQNQKTAAASTSSSVVVPPTFDARTLHSCAHRLLQSHYFEEKKKKKQQNNNNNDGQDDNNNKKNTRLWSTKKIKQWIADTCASEIEQFLQPCYLELASRRRRSSNDSNFFRFLDSEKTRAREQVEFFIYKSLVHFTQSSWTLEMYRSGKPFNRDYYPMKKFHKASAGNDGKGKAYGFDPRIYDTPQKIAFYALQACRLWELILKDAEDGEPSIRSFDFEMKQAQLLGLRVPGTILLVDESQDMDACQVDWIARHQVHTYGTHVYVVGDAAQSIYGFRGAKPQFLLGLRSDVDRMLTESWRFGPAISRMANLILYAKEHSDQTCLTPDGRHYKNWIPYRTRSGCPEKLARVTTEPLVTEWRRMKVTIIARSNASLLMEALGALGFDFDRDENDNDDTGGDSQDDEEEEEVQHDDNNNANGPAVLHRQPLVTQDDDDDYEDEDFEPLPEDSVSRAKGGAGSVERLAPHLPKIAINGRGEGSGMRLWKKVLKLIDSVYMLYQLSEDPYATTTLDNKLFPDFVGKRVSWRSFCDECTEKELTEYGNAIIIVSKYKHQTRQVMGVFQSMVMDQRFSPEEADIILTTCHSAKGMEWDNVHVCDDFINFSTFKKGRKGKVVAPPVAKVEEGPGKKKPRLATEWSFNFDSWGDDVNLAYVACTRAKQMLSIPPCIAGVLDALDALHTWNVSTSSESNNGVNHVAVQVPGYPYPLKKEEAESFYNSIVLPLRKELDVLGMQLMKPELVEYVVDDENGNDGVAAVVNDD